MTDEETLESAFLSALHKHFKKPGPFLPDITLPLGEVWKPQIGEVWEVYAYSQLGDTLYRNGLGWASLNPQCWCPSGGWAQPDVITEWTVAGAVYTATSYNAGGAAYSPRSEGWILNSEDALSTTAGAIRLRMRRRFDLET